MGLDYMETISQKISHHLEIVKQADVVVRGGRNLGQWEELRVQEEKALKLALQEKIRATLAISVHVRFIRFCTWLKNQEETGSIEEQLLWERTLLGVDTSVKSEIEEALKEVADIEEGRFSTKT